jgi:hypothetical protein
LHVIRPIEFGEVWHARPNRLATRKPAAPAREWRRHRCANRAAQRAALIPALYLNIDHCGAFMKIIACFLVVVCIVPHAYAGELKLETLMRTQLEGVKNTEVILSRAFIPANSSLPKHWHPGEEFVYVLDGSVTLWQKGRKMSWAKRAM